MSTGSKIEWTDATWNPVRGCTRVSEGCRHCYAEAAAARFAAVPGGGYEGLAVFGEHGPRWTGKIVCDEAKLAEPLHWRKPRRVFVNSMSDLFHEDVPFTFVERVFAVMARAGQHSFQVLTKRPERMQEYLEWQGGDVIDAMTKQWPVDLSLLEVDGAMPLGNVWLGVSCEDQAAADARIMQLLLTPAKVRFVSLEPLLGPIDLMGVTRTLPSVGVPITGAVLTKPSVYRHEGRGLDWIIVGGESGPHARPCELEWIESIIGQCKAAGVPCFVKQLGSVWARGRNADIMEMARRRRAAREPLRLLCDSKGGCIAEWPETLRVRQWPNTCVKV